MKNFIDFLNEATVRGNAAIPGESGDRSERGYLSDIDRQKQTELRGARIPEIGRQMMELIGRSKELLVSDIVSVRQFNSGRLSEEQKTRIEERFTKLEELAESVIRNLYGEIIKNVDLDIQLLFSGNEVGDFMGEEQENTKERNKEKEEEEKEEEEKEEEKKDSKKKSTPEKRKEKSYSSEQLKNAIDKRKISNLIIQGEAKNTKTILHSDEVKAGLNEIFGQRKATEIFQVWDELTKAADKMDWLIPIEHKADMLQNQPEGMAGAVKVEWKKPDFEDEEQQEEMNQDQEERAKNILDNIENGGDINDDENQEEAQELFSQGKPTVHSRGIDFPMLLHETVKGIYELIMSAGISKNRDLAKEVSRSTDTFLDEAEDFRYGPQIAADIRDFINKFRNIEKYDNLREFVLGAMMAMEDVEFLKLVKGILLKTPAARKQIDDIASEIVAQLDEWELHDALPTEEYPDQQEDEEGDVLPEPPKSIENKPASKANVEEEEGPIDYSTMGRRDLQSALDAAIDAGDFATVDKIAPFIKESSIYKVYESEISKLLRRKK